MTATRITENIAHLIDVVPEREYTYTQFLNQIIAMEAVGTYGDETEAITQNHLDWLKDFDPSSRFGWLILEGGAVIQPYLIG